MTNHILSVLAWLGLLAMLGLLACAPDEATPPTDTNAATEETGDGDGDDCLGPDGCFDCEPTTPIDLSNACTDATCEPFPNTQDRLPLLEGDGSLPPLP